MWDQTRPDRAWTEPLPPVPQNPVPQESVPQESVPPGAARSGPAANGMPPGSVGRHARPEDVPVYGRAAVPVPARTERALRGSTAELPVVRVRPPAVSWYRPSRASLRSLSDGWGFTATGLLIAFCGWGVWAAAGRGAIAAPLVGFGIVCAVAAGVFALCRVLGRVILVGLLHRTRPHARFAHLLTGLFLTAAGIAYLGQTSWIRDGWAWIQEQLQRF